MYLQILLSNRNYPITCMDLINLGDNSSVWDLLILFIDNGCRFSPYYRVVFSECYRHISRKLIHSIGSAEFLIGIGNSGSNFNKSQISILVRAGILLMSSIRSFYLKTKIHLISTNLPLS